MTLGPTGSSTPPNAAKSSEQSVNEQLDRGAADPPREHTSPLVDDNPPLTMTRGPVRITSKRASARESSCAREQWSDVGEQRSVVPDERSPWSLKYRLAMSVTDHILTSWGSALRAVLILATLAVVLRLLHVDLQFGPLHLYGGR